MAALSDEISAFEAQQSKLESDHSGKWVVFFDHQLQGIYPTLESAAQDAIHKFGRGPYLIRQIGAPPVTLPASVMYYSPDAIR